MDILSFLLGISVVLILMGVMVIFSMYRKITNLGEKLTTTIDIQNDQFRLIDSNREEIHRRIDGEIGRVDKLTNDLFGLIDSRSETLFGLIDSRSETINSRIIAETNRIETQFIMKLTNSNNQTEKMIDSRLDKLENKLKVTSSKQVINE